MTPSVATAADILEMLAHGLQGEKVQLRQILAIAGDRGIGAILLLLALPQVMPIPVVLSNLLALPVVLVAAQMSYGIQRPWLPRWLLECEVRRNRLVKGCVRLVSVLRQMERVIGPRPYMVRLRAGSPLLGSCCLIISLLLLAPLPLVTWFPAWALFAIAIGLLERDDLVVLGGLLLGSVSVLAFGAAVVGLLEVGDHVKAVG
jgi:hypothetical protein